MALPLGHLSWGERHGVLMHNCRHLVLLVHLGNANELRGVLVEVLGVDSVHRLVVEADHSLLLLDCLHCQRLHIWGVVVLISRRLPLLH